jgi:hypothetical protein
MERITVAVPADDLRVLRHLLVEQRKSLASVFREIIARYITPVREREDKMKAEVLAEAAAKEEVDDARPHS